MSEETAAGAVMDVVEPAQVEISGKEPEESTASEEAQPGRKAEDARQDNRRQPDMLKKHVGELRRRAEAMTDPAEKQAELDRIKFLYDTSGKARGYEEQFPTVREAREVKALLDAVGGRDGVSRMQQVLSEVEEIDKALASGDAAVIDRMWEEAPEGMPKLVPAILDRFAREKPEEYQRLLAPHSIGYLDRSGFTQAFDRMVSLYEAGKTEEAREARDAMVRWVVGSRGDGKSSEGREDPEVRRLQDELKALREGSEAQKVDSAYNSVIAHAGPALAGAARPVIGRLGLTREENAAFMEAVWSHLQSTRNASETYKTIAPAKQRQGYDAWVAYAKRWTEDNALVSVRAVLKTPPWSRLAASGKVAAAPATKAPGAPGPQKGAEPSPAEIDYGPKGASAARKAGFSSLADMLLEGQAPLKAGGIRKWR